MLESHLLISKAGGATVQETIAAKCPMIISQIVPGQEEGNARLIEETRSGAVATTAEAIIARGRNGPLRMTRDSGANGRKTSAGSAGRALRWRLRSCCSGCRSGVRALREDAAVCLVTSAFSPAAVTAPRCTGRVAQALGFDPAFSFRT